ncbi:hypothetical protein BKA70DRAFT_1527904 [Coprinopsis sp. MPI-PUGE-AT-0042]|nr:hypothetical protein BKA70DRAFT_1527904 [Coprinopsis sp. MPI-PUGE-AT-0042]
MEGIMISGPTAAPSSATGPAPTLKRPLDDEFQDSVPAKRSRAGSIDGAESSTHSSQSIDQHMRSGREEGSPAVEPQDQSSRLTFNVGTSLARYLSWDPLEISPPPSLDTKVGHAFIKVTYEATSHYSFHCIPAHKNPTGGGERRIAWPKSTKNPLMARVPGRPGIMYLEWHDPFPNGPLSLVSSVPPSPGKCKAGHYLGEYETRDMGRMSTEWFTAQHDKVKSEWAHITRMAHHGDVLRLRARVALRKHGVIHREEKEGDDSKVDAEVAAVLAGAGHPIDVNDVVLAFIRGDELPPIRLVHVACVRYDQVFADDMKAKWPAYQAAQGVEGKKSNKRTVEGGFGNEGRWRSDEGMPS